MRLLADAAGQLSVFSYLLPIALGLAGTAITLASVFKGWGDRQTARLSASITSWREVAESEQAKNVVLREDNAELERRNRELTNRNNRLWEMIPNKNRGDFDAE